MTVGLLETNLWDTEPVVPPIEVLPLAARVHMLDLTNIVMTLANKMAEAVALLDADESDAARTLLADVLKISTSLH